MERVYCLIKLIRNIMCTKELKVKKSDALKAWRNGNSESKILLENLYGADTFKNQNVTDRIQSFEDAMEETGRPNVPDFSNLPEDMRTYHESLYKMTVIAEAINEGWTPNWDNDNERKWRPWFVMSPSGFAFDTSLCDRSLAIAGGSSRLCFKTEALATYAAKQFIDLWKSIQLK